MIKKNDYVSIIKESDSLFKVGSIHRRRYYHVDDDARLNVRVKGHLSSVPCAMKTTLSLMIACFSDI